MDAPLARRLIAEAVGTGILVLFGAGSVVAALTVGGGKIDYAALGMISLAFALAVALAIYAFGETSGAHINPAVTVSLATVGRFPWADVPGYIGAQAVGATAGAALIVAAFGGHAVDLGTGATTISDGTGYFQAIVAEAIGTYLLVLAIMALAVDTRAPAGWAGFMIGLAVLAAILLIGPLTGGSLNPARTFGPLLVNTIGGGDTNWGDLGRKLPHAAILKIVSTNICGSDQHMVRGRTTAPEGLILGHEITGEVIEAGRDVEFIKKGDLVLGAVQHRLRPLPQLQGRQDRHLPERQPRPARRGLRLRRHGRLGRRPGRVRHGPLRRLQPAEVPRQGPGDGEDPRPDAALRHLPDRLPRRGHRGRRPRLDRLRRGRRAGRPGLRAPRPHCSARPSSSSAT